MVLPNQCTCDTRAGTASCRVGEFQKALLIAGLLVHLPGDKPLLLAQVLVDQEGESSLAKGIEYQGHFCLQYHPVPGLNIPFLPGSPPRSSTSLLRSAHASSPHNDLSAPRLLLALLACGRSSLMVSDGLRSVACALWPFATAIKHDVQPEGNVSVDNWHFK